MEENPIENSSQKGDQHDTGMVTPPPRGASGDGLGDTEFDKEFEANFGFRSVDKGSTSIRAVESEDDMEVARLFGDFDSDLGEMDDTKAASSPQQTTGMSEDSPVRSRSPRRRQKNVGGAAMSDVAQASNAKRMAWEDQGPDEAKLWS